MTIRDFINAYIGFFEQIKIMEYTGDYSAIGADLEEDYEVKATYKDFRDIPKEILSRNVEYFDIDADVITIWMMIY
jgi:hypothetical protein